MKKQLLIILTAISSIHCYSQISFEKGYFINNNEQKIECLIKNTDWKNNPKEFQYKLSENSIQKKATIKLVKEFGVYNYSKYIRNYVNIDRSSSILDNLSNTKEPIFKKEELFLQVLVDGKLKLYHYQDKNLTRFFFKKNNSNNIEQLIFKNYKSDDDDFIRENNGFKQQLITDLKCENIKISDIKKIKYNKNDLVNFFTKYNQCNNSELVNFVEKQKKDLFNLTIRPRLNSSSLSVRSSSPLYSTDFGNEIGFGFGIEAELIFPFHKNKWSIIIEPTYKNFKSEKELLQSNPSSVKIDYESIELGVGIRHYLFLNNNDKLFINGSYILDLPSNSKIIYNSGLDYDIFTDTNLGIGIGYKQNDKYSLEIRYQPKRDLLDYKSRSSEYKTFSIILGYSIF